MSLSCLLLLFSCAVTNNLYVNDPVPTQNGEASLYLGVGTGVRAEIESVDPDGTINFSDEVSMAPNFYFGGQLNVVDKLGLRFSMHLPYLIGGFGLRAGPQYSFFKKESKFNMAVGTDLGFVVAKDSIKIFGSSSPLDIHANGAINADFFIPFSFSFNEYTRIILTPRYSFNTIFIRYNTGDDETYKFRPNVLSMALGMRIKRFYFEYSSFRYQGQYFPNFSIVYMLNNKEQE